MSDNVSTTSKTVSNIVRKDALRKVQLSTLEILAEADKKLKNNFEESRARFIIEEAMIKLMMV